MRFSISSMSTSPSMRVLNQIAQQVVHRRVVGRIKNKPPLLPRRSKSGCDQLLEVKSQAAIGLDPQPLGNPPDRQAFTPRTHQQPEDFKTGFMGQRTQRGDSKFRFHISIIVEIWNLYR